MSIVLALTTAVVGLSFILLPELSRPTVPLAVSVPSTRLDEPVVTRALRRFRIGTGVVMVAGILASLLLSRLIDDAGLVVGAVIIPVAVIVADVAVLVVARRPIVEAKASEGWYEGVRVGTATPLLASNRRFSRGAIAAFVVTVAILVLVTVAGLLRWPTLPDQMPVHFDASGTPDRWEAKSVWSVFGLHIVMAATIALLVALSLASPTRRQHPDGRADLGRAEAQGRSQVIQATLATAALLLALVDAALSAAIWWAADTDMVRAITASTIVASLAVCVIPIVLSVRMRREIAAVAPGDTETPDDESHWRLGGQVYLNRDDPSAFVPKRVGVGYTVNVASFGGVIFMIAVGVIIIGSIILTVLASTGVLS